MVKFLQKQEDKTMTINDVGKMMVSERISTYMENEDTGREEFEQAEHLMQLIKDKCPELVDDFQKYIDFVSSSGGKIHEGLYMFGLYDGIRIMKKIMQIH